MSVLSASDKLRLRVSQARVERWNIERRKPIDPTIVRCKGTLFAHGQDKTPEDIQPDRLDSLYRKSDGHKFRSMSGKLGNHGNAIAARVHTIVKLDHYTGEEIRQIVHDVPENDSVGTDAQAIGARGKGASKVYNVGKSGVAKPRPDSPFKKTGVRNLVIVRV